MPIKTFKCTICGAEVTKPQSYAVDGGRACRSHQEAVDAQAQREAEVAQHRKEVAARKPVWQTHRTAQTMEDIEAAWTQRGWKYPRKYCWHCHKDGVELHTVLERRLVHMSRAKLEGEQVNPFAADSPDLQRLRKEMGEKVVLRVLPLPEDMPDWKLNQLIRPLQVQDPALRTDMRQIARFGQAICLCNACASEFGLDFYVKEVMPKKMDVEQLYIVGKLAEEHFDSIAMKEMLKEIADGTRDKPRT